MAAIPPSAAAPPAERRSRAFCVAVSANGAPAKTTGDSVQDFAQLLEHATLAWVDVTVDRPMENAPAVAAALGFSPPLVSSLLATPFSAYEDLETELGIAVPAVQVDRMVVKTYPLLILVRKGLIATLHPPEVVRLQRFYRYADTFMKKIKPSLAWNDRLTLFLTRVLDENNESNFAGLRRIQEQGGEIGKLLIEPTALRPEVGKEIYQMKQALIAYLDALWATLDVLHSLRYGDAETISDEARHLQRISILGEEVNRHISLSEQMSTVLASGLEVLQSIYNNQLAMLNNRLSYGVSLFTVVGTAILVPNTLATFGPEVFGLEARSPLWPLILLVSTVVSTLGVYLWVKRRGLLPSSFPGSAKPSAK